jgi:hypothetical protein
MGVEEEVGMQSIGMLGGMSADLLVRSYDFAEIEALQERDHAARYRQWAKQTATRACGPRGRHATLPSDTTG